MSVKSRAWMRETGYSESDYVEWVETEIDRLRAELAAERARVEWAANRIFAQVIDRAEGVRFMSFFHNDGPTGSCSEAVIGDSVEAFRAFVDSKIGEGGDNA